MEISFVWVCANCKEEERPPIVKDIIGNKVAKTGPVLLVQAVDVSAVEGGEGHGGSLYLSIGPWAQFLGTCVIDHFILVA